MVHCLLNEILGEKIISLARICIERGSSRIVLRDTLVFTLSNGRVFEMLTDQASTKFQEISAKQGLFVDFELDSDEVLVTQELDDQHFNFNLPLAVASITEIWANIRGERFLAAIVLKNEDGKPALSLGTETDEVELLSFASLQDRINYDMKFAYELEQLRYSMN